jgi:hypothetical protein
MSTDTEPMQIEFTDRYGGNCPAWIRGCHGPCEAMGFYPTQDRSKWPAGTRPVGTPEEDGTPDDGWRFVECPDCGGSGHVSWFRSIFRIPRWLWRSLRFIIRVARDSEFDPRQTFRQRLRLGIYAGFWCDFRRIVSELRHGA